MAETGTSWVITILDDGQNRIHISLLAEVEIVAALTRRHRIGDLTQQQLDQACAEVRQDTAAYVPLLPTNDLIRGAVTLARSHGLRAYDAIQLASAIQVRSVLVRNEPNADVIMVSADLELNAAAVAEGLQVENPNDH